MKTKRIATKQNQIVSALIIFFMVSFALAGCSDDDAITNPLKPETPNTPPVMEDIKDQTIDEGSIFQTINLDQFVTDAEDADSKITWSYSGNQVLTVAIQNRVAMVLVPRGGWSGTETIVFMAMDTGKLTVSDQARFTINPKIVVPPSVKVLLEGAGEGGCSTCFQSGDVFGASLVVSGLTGSVKYQWSLVRFGQRELSSSLEKLSKPIYLPGDYSLNLTVNDNYGHQASTRVKFSVKHSWWDSVPWGTYRTIRESGEVYFNFDDALKLVELKEPIYSYLYHDWVAAEFMHKETGAKLYLFNRPKKIRFRNNFAEILYALVISGDNNWWSGNVKFNRHWNLASGSADRKFLNDYKLVSVARINYPPQHRYDRIHYYGE